MAVDTRCHARNSVTLAALLTLVAAPHPVEWQYPARDQFALDGAVIIPDELPDVGLGWGYVTPALMAQLRTLLGQAAPVDLWLPTDGGPPAAPDQAHVPYGWVRGWLTPPDSSSSFAWDGRGQQTWTLKGAEVVS